MDNVNSMFLKYVEIVKGVLWDCSQMVIWKEGIYYLSLIMY